MYLSALHYIPNVPKSTIQKKPATASDGQGTCITCNGGVDGRGTGSANELVHIPLTEFPQTDFSSITGDYQMNPDQSTPSTSSSASKKATRSPPTKRAALVGGVVGIYTGLSSHFLILDQPVVSITICLLYAVGVTLMIDYVSILRQTPHDGGSWWTIAFGATIGLVLMVIQMVFHPVVTDKMAVRRSLPEGAITVPLGYVLILWLLIFGVALVSLAYGIGMAVADLSEG